MFVEKIKMVARSLINTQGIYMLETSRKRFSIDIHELLTFVNFFIRHCSTKDAKKNITEAHGKKQSTKKIISYRKNMVDYKNSLYIMNHFKNRL